MLALRLSPSSPAIFGGRRTAVQQLIDGLRARGGKAWIPSTNPTTGWFQDSAGTTPAALEQPVGRILDLSGNGYHATQATSANRPTYTRKVNVFNSPTDSFSSAITGTTFAGSHVLYVESGSITLSGTATGTYGAGTHSVTCAAGTLTATPTGTVTNLDCRLSAFAAMNLPVYQSVTSATVYDTAGFRDMLYFDGVNDSLATPNIDLTGTDQIDENVSVVKLDDSTTSMIYERSVSAGATDGASAIFLTASNARYYARSRGTSESSASSAGSYTAPSLACLRHVADISDDLNKLYRNGIEIASSVTDQGTGNYTSQPLYIGGRAGTSFFFKGYMIPGPLFDSTGISPTLLDAVAREHAALWGVTI